MSKKKSRRKLLFLVKRTVVFLSVVVPLSLLYFPAYDISHPELVVFPAKDIRNRLFALTDEPFDGKSVIEDYSIRNDTISLSYLLKEGATASSPMVFTTLSVGTAEKPFDLSVYESVSITIREVTCKSIMIFMKTFVPGISKPETKNAYSLRHNQYVLEVSPEPREYTIRLDEFYTPSWWLEMMNVSDTKLPRETFRSFVAFDMQFNLAGSDYELGRHEKVVIEKIAFHRSLTPAGAISIVFLSLYYAGLLVFVIVRKLRDSKLAIPDRKPVEVATYREKDLARIREFVESHYSDPDISTRVIYKDLGIPQDRVFALVMSEYGVTFKQLINKMRIQEAKRLLRETDLRVIDIALNLGFNNISYFNNIFKANVGVTPSDFRDKGTENR